MVSVLRLQNEVACKYIGSGYVMSYFRTQVSQVQTSRYYSEVGKPANVGAVPFW